MALHNIFVHSIALRAIAFAIIVAGTSGSDIADRGTEDSLASDQGGGHWDLGQPSGSITSWAYLILVGVLCIALVAGVLGPIGRSWCTFADEIGGVDALFFWLGAASDITFNGIVLSVAYLVSQFGKTILVEIGRAQFLASTSAMLFLFALALRNPSSTVGALRAKCKVLMTAMGYMLWLNIAMLLFVIRGWSLTHDRLWALMFLNGLATGTSQSLVGVISGLMTKFGGHPSAASAQMSGVGFGIALPTVVQLSLMPLAVPSGIVAGLSYGLAAALSLCGMVALAILRNTESFRRCEHGGIDELAGQPIEKAFAEKFRGYARTRFVQVFFPSLALLANFASMVYCGLLTPRVPTHGTVPSPINLPTCLLGVSNACDFLGRVLAQRLLRQRIDGSFAFLAVPLQQLPVLFVLLMVRLSFGCACLLYCVLGPPRWPNGSNIAIITIYGMGAFVGGMTTVSLTQFAQALCMLTSGPNMGECRPLPCPLAGQIMWLACVFGSVSGALLPFP